MVDSATIHIVDDDKAIRDSLSLLLKIEGYATFAHQSAVGLLEAIGHVECDCVVTDLRMPGMTGIDLLSALRKRRAALPVILLTAHADVPMAVQAMKMGAVDILEKPFNDDALLTSIRHALTRGKDDRGQNTRIQAILSKYATLTKREIEVLSWLLKGQPNKVIADEMGISKRTVEVHRASVMAKMEAQSLAELVQMALLVKDEGLAESSS
ncbi:MAG: response regulator [Methylocystis sp.]|jgi:two-component system response regulator FixJ